jgi:chromosomal replication initiation ATPase DnaA
MTNDTWDKALARLFSSKDYSGLKQLLENCRPEQKEKTLVVRTPGTFYHPMLAKPDGIAILKETFCVDGVKFEQDEALKKAYLDNVSQRPPAQAEPKTGLDERLEKATDGKVMTHARAEKIIANILTYFSNTDHISEENRPDKNPYQVTAANGMAYRAVKRLLNAFPDAPGERPLLLHAKVGMGKTHLLQHFAWQLADKIEQARDMYRRQDAEAGRTLLELGDVPPETVLRRLEKTAKTRIRYITAEEFTDEHILSTNKGAWKGRQGDSESFKQEREMLYDTLDVLFLDDLHAFSRGGKTSTLEYAYKVVNRMYNAGKAVISAIDTPPKTLLERVKDPDIKHDFERLLSRCHEGSIVDIENPAREDLADIINTRLRRLSPELPAVSITDLKNGAFFSVAKSYRDALTVANTAYKFTLEGISVDKAVANAIGKLKETRAVEGDLFTQ